MSTPAAPPPLVTPKAIPVLRLEKFRADIEDRSAWVTGPLDRAEAAALCGDALHWRAMYLTASKLMAEADARVEELEREIAAAWESGS